MKKLAHKQDSFGSVDIFGDYKCNLFLARPHGFINPILLKEDLARATEFSSKVDGVWHYVTNTEDVLFSNPLNLLYLKEIKKLAKLQEIVIFAPSLRNRLMLYLAAPIVMPDRIIDNKEEFDAYLAELKTHSHHSK